jgi:hypothetical protein
MVLYQDNPAKAEMLLHLHKRVGNYQGKLKGLAEERRSDARQT